MWISTLNNGLFHWNIKQKVLIHYKKQIDKEITLGPIDDQIQHICYDYEKNIVISTKNGLSIFNPATKLFRHFPPLFNNKKGLPARNIKYAFDDGNKIWLATYGSGLQCLDKKTGTFHGITTKEGLPNDALYSVIPDGNGKLWLGTNNGLAVFDPQNKNIVNFNSFDGLPDNEFNGFSATQSERGFLLYSTLNGIVKVDTRRTPSTEKQLHLVVTKFEASNGRIDSIYNTYKKIRYELPPGYNTLYISFALLLNTAPNRYKYKIKLEGYDDNWISLQDANFIRINQLKPGKYTLTVQADDVFTKTKHESKKIYITIKPYWYQHFIFKSILFTLCIVTIILLISQYIKNKLQRQKAEYIKTIAIQNERQRISYEIHDDIGASLSAIKLLTELIIKKSSQNETQKITEIYNAVGDLNTKIREVIWSLNIENDYLDKLINYLEKDAHKLFQNSSIKLSINTPSSVPNIELSGEKRRNISLILRESLHNVIKHSNSNYCNVRFQIYGNVLKIEITDDGHGVEHKIENITTNGLKSIKKRIDLLHGTFSISKGEKTILTFYIPLNSTL
jgi:signal transduction histidine kinase